MRKTFNKVNGGFQWLYESENGESLSIICHNYSYGFADGNFETMCSWLNDVQGHQSFGQVQRKIDTIIRREIKYKAVQS